MGRFEASAEHTPGRITISRFFRVAGFAGAVLLSALSEPASAQQVNPGVDEIYGGKLSNQDPNGGSKTGEERARQKEKNSRKKNNRGGQAVTAAPSQGDRLICGQGFVIAINKDTGEIRNFNNTCFERVYTNDPPSRWERIDRRRTIFSPSSR